MKDILKKIILIVSIVFIGTTFISCNKKLICNTWSSTIVNASYQKNTYDIEKEEVIFDIGIGIDPKDAITEENWYQLRATAFEQYKNPSEYYMTDHSKVLEDISSTEVDLYPLIHIDETHVETRFKESYSIPIDIFSGTDGYLAISLVIVTADQDDPLFLHFDSEVYVEFKYKLEGNQIQFERLH